jgi:ribonuclease HII
MVSHTVIDTKGLTYATRLGVKRALKKLEIKKNVLVLLDGSLYAPKEYKQKTIIGGDDTYKIIGLASIVAKVKRDRRMKNLSKQYPGYSFDVHSGYGTKKHYEAIKKNGISLIHRRSFLKSLTGVKK